MEEEGKAFFPHRKGEVYALMNSMAGILLSQRREEQSQNNLNSGKVGGAKGGTDGGGMLSMEDLFKRGRTETFFRQGADRKREGSNNQTAYLFRKGGKPGESRSSIEGEKKKKLFLQNLRRDES